MMNRKAVRARKSSGNERLEDNSNEMDEIHN